jgi:hypothetical protein
MIRRQARLSLGHRHEISAFLLRNTFEMKQYTFRHCLTYYPKF